MYDWYLAIISFTTQTQGPIPRLLCSQDVRETQLIFKARARPTPKFQNHWITLMVHFSTSNHFISASIGSFDPWVRVHKLIQSIMYWILDHPWLQAIWVSGFYHASRISVMPWDLEALHQAPHPMNLVAPHLMVELRSAGFIEICGDLDPVPWAAPVAMDQGLVDRGESSPTDAYNDSWWL